MLKLISIIDGVFDMKEYMAEIDYQPDLKYKINKKYALDPTISIKRDPYHEDSLSLTAILSPDEYDELYAILNSPAGTGLDGSIFFVEFEHNGAMKQLPVEVDKLPKMSDYQRFGNEKSKFSLISKYKTYTPIDFENIFGYGNSYGENYGF